MTMGLFAPRTGRKLHVTVDGRTYVAHAERDVLLDLSPEPPLTLDDVTARLQLVTPSFRPDSAVISAKAVTAPNHLVVSRVWLTPEPLRKSRRFEARIEVTDRRGRPVHGALVSIRSVPDEGIRTVAQRLTDGDGTASFVLEPSRQLRRRRGRVTMFIRASKVGDESVDATSGRRLVTLALPGAA
jgi:hypothetical protein